MNQTCADPTSAKAMATVNANISNISRNNDETN